MTGMTRMPDRRALLRGGTAVALAAALPGCTPATAPSGAASQRMSAAPPTRSASPASPASAADWSALGRGLAGTLVRPGDADYATAARLYNTRFDALRPAAVAYVAGTADIAECLAFARRTGTPVRIRSGGHSYAGWSSGTGRLIVDVSRLAAIRTGAGTATVGAGARLIDVYTALGERGVTVPAGSCPTVAVSGLTLGGGHGVTSRAYGLTCDNLTGATLVTADGRTVLADADTNPGLFWALRGGGNGGLGVVTELRFRTHPAPECVTAYLTFPWSRAAAVLRSWQGWGPDQPDEIWSALHLDAAAGGSPAVTVTAFSLGGRTELENAVDRLVSGSGGPAGSVTVRRHGYLQAMDAYAGCTDRTPAQCHLPGRTPGRTASGTLGRETYTGRSDFYDRPLPDAGIAALLAQMEALRSRRGGGSGSVALTALGGAVNRVGTLATAFVHRTSRFLAQYIASDALSTTGWLDGLHSAMRPYASGAAYQNYADPTLTSWRQAYYGPASGRLAVLRHQWDPDRVFDAPQAP